MSHILELDDVHTYYGNIHALKGVSLTVDKGEIVTLIGSNGAGKSTTLRTISGMPAHKVAELKVAQSPEGRRVFPRMSVLENLEMGAFVNKRVDPADLDRVFDLFPRLKERRTQKAGTMSGGEQQMLAIGRALMADPKLLLLDEPSMGIAPILVDRIYETIVEINRQGTTILLVEQSATHALDCSRRGYVMETGKVALTDSCDALLENPDVQKAYLGA